MKGCGGRSGQGLRLGLLLLLSLLTFFHHFHALYGLHCLLGVDRLERVVADRIELVEFLGVLFAIAHIFLIIYYNLKILVLIVSLREVGRVLLLARWLKGHVHLHDIVPLQSVEEGVGLDFGDILIAETLLGVHDEELVDEILSLGRHLVFSSADRWIFNIPGLYSIKDLKWSGRLEWKCSCEELIDYHSKGPEIK